MAMSIIARLGLATKDFSKSLDKVEGETKTFGDKFGKLIKAGVAIAGTALAGFSAKGITEFTKFEAEMNRVFTLLPQSSRKTFSSMDDDVRKLARTMGLDLAKVTDALYNTISAGVDPGNAISFLQDASKTAIGGVTDLNTAVGALTTIINGYGLEAKDAGKISDVLFQIVNGGVTTMDELGKNIGQVAPIAGQLGVSFKDLGAMIASLTKVMGQGNTPQVMTGLRQMLSELAKEGTKASDAFKKVAGTGFTDFIKNGGSVMDALIKMKNHADKNNLSMLDMFRSIEAGKTAMGLMVNEGKDLAKQLEQMSKSAGKTDDAFATMEGSLSRTFDKIKAGVKDMAIGFGKELEPVIRRLLPGLEDGFDGAIKAVGSFGKSFAGILNDIIDLKTEIGLVIGALASYKVALGVAGVAVTAFSGTKKGLARELKLMAIAFGAFKVGNFTKTLKASKLALTSLVPALGALMNPIGLAGVAIAGLGTAFFLVNKKIQENKKLAEEASKIAREKLGKDIKALGDKMNDAEQRGKDLNKELNNLRNQKDIKVGVALVEKDLVDQLKESIKLEEKRLEKLKKTEEKLRDLKKQREKELEQYKEINAEALAGAKGEKARQLANKWMIKDKLEILNLENDITQNLIDQENVMGGIKDLSKKIVDLAQAKKNTEAKIAGLIGKARKEHELEQTTIGKIQLKLVEIQELEKKRAELIEEAKKKRVLEDDKAKELVDTEGAILDARKDINTLIKNETLKLLGKEKDAIDEQVEALKDLLEIEDERIENADENAKKKAEEIKTLRQQYDDAEASLDRFRAFFQKDFFGNIKSNWGAIAKEFEKLKKSGQIPSNVKSVRDYQKLLLQQGKVAKKTRDDILKAGKSAYRQEKQIQAEKSRALKEKKRLEDQIAKKTGEILKKEEDIQKVNENQLSSLESKMKALGGVVDDFGDLKLIPPKFPKEMVTALNQQKDELSNIDQGIDDILNKEIKTKMTDPKITLESTQKEILNVLKGYFVNQ